MNKEKTVLVIIISVVAVLGFIVVMSLIIVGPSQKKVVTPPPVVLSSPTPVSSAPVIISYDNQKRDQLVDKIAGKKVLSSQDKHIKSQVLAALDGKSGVVDSEEGYTIIYLKAPDIFQVEISTINYQIAKEKATEWFKLQGFSFSGICNLPVQFYLSAQVKYKLKDKDINFNPLPEGC